MNLLDITQNINPTRNFNLLYVILDSIFIIFLLGILIYKKQFITLIWALFGGILYVIVDYGYFHLISESRVVYVNGVENALYTFLVLLWMSLSYGITNFIFIWVCLTKNKYKKEFLILIVGWWLIIPSVASLGGEATITTFRTTTAYHHYMAIILLVGYATLIMFNIIYDSKINILSLLLIGISVQFAWEFALLINGIRPLNSNSLTTLIINSLIETNLGLPYMYFICKAVYKKYNEDLTRVTFIGEEA